MFIDEALWIHDVLSQIPLPARMTLLDVGSSTAHFRQIEQPHIDRYLFRPLEAQGVSIVHLDAKDAAGVDVVYDIGNHDHELAIGPFDVVICCNLLEHVVNRDKALHRLRQWVKPQGYLLITVPHVYRRHLDPIDTMYRPSNRDLAVLFPHDRIIRSEIVTVHHVKEYTKRGFYRYLQYVIPSLRWKVSCVLVQRSRVVIEA
ncbi:MAG: methyltransferase domain-containing protein [Candidatus Latescibacteria bacterium]|nr:methyltransferase domain-containing protein [Candidatus Latescibacterota bacterium]